MGRFTFIIISLKYKDSLLLLYVHIFIIEVITESITIEYEVKDGAYRWNY